METVASIDALTLKRLREQKGWTLLEFAAKLADQEGRVAISHVAVIKLEKVGSQNIERLESIARVYGITLAEARDASKNTSAENCN